MSKVSVDRELLEQIVNTNMADYAVIAYQHKEIRSILARPAEAEGVSNSRLMNTLAELARRAPLRTLHTICETQHQVSTVKLERYLESVGDTLAGYAFTLRIDYDKLRAALSAVTAERDKIKADYEYLLKNAHSLNGALTNTERDRIAVTAERDRLREEVERIALENDGHDQRRIRWAEELKQLRAEVERLREAELLLLSVCNDLMRHENADVRMVTCIELNNWLTRRAAMDAKEA